MNSSDLLFNLVPDDDWSQELAVQVLEGEGGRVPPDDDPPEPLVSSSKVNMQKATNPQTPHTRGSHNEVAKNVVCGG
jgi:hypothetical protein